MRPTDAEFWKKARVVFPAAKQTITTPDRKYTIRTVACFGQCALAPVVEINHEIYGHQNERALRSEIDAIEKEKR